VRLGADEILVDADRPFHQGETVKVRIPARSLFIFNAPEFSASPNTH
jgi:putative spermidine/putrescine transport system ATP-binding protein